jgi:hypothetical protein
MTRGKRVNLPHACHAASRAGSVVPVKRGTAALSGGLARDHT